MIKVLWPERIDLKYWADSLVADYLTEILPVLSDEKNWRSWGEQVAGTGIFLAASVPSPIGRAAEREFKNWDDWARVVYLIMSNEYNN